MGLILLSPLLLIIYLLIRLTSPGPGFYLQPRVGVGRRIFLLVKFRTMIVDPEAHGALVTARGDSRVTGVGNFLRRTKLDELPELWNVLKGDMSIVGPRPEVPRYVEHYLPGWEPVFSVRPGITDLATLHFRDEESVLESAYDREMAYINVVLPMKMKLALQYISESSFLYDLRIIFLTLWGITLGRWFWRLDNRLAQAAKAAIQASQSSSEIKD